jgi:hypothetical protein
VEKGNTQPAKEKQKQVEAAQETAASPNSQEIGGSKRPATQTRGSHKKMKAQRLPPEYTITNEYAEMIARMVQDCLSENFDHAAHHRDKLQKEFAEMG